MYWITLADANFVVFKQKSQPIYELTFINYSSSSINFPYFSDRAKNNADNAKTPTVAKVHSSLTARLISSFGNTDPKKRKTANISNVVPKRL